MRAARSQVACIKRKQMAPKPNEIEVSRCLSAWYRLTNHVKRESSLEKLFRRTYSLNSDIDDVLIKVCALNDFYGSDIFSRFSVADHIVALGIDDRLQAKDLLLVHEIASVQMVKGITQDLYSFASKYCSHHFPAEYPIYDYYAERLLLYFQTADSFSNFAKGDLKDYSKYRHILLDFQAYYGLGAFNLKQIDKYFWQTSREYFYNKF